MENKWSSKECDAILEGLESYGCNISVLQQLLIKKAPYKDFLKELYTQFESIKETDIFKQLMLDINEEIAVIEIQEIFQRGNK